MRTLCIALGLAIAFPAFGQDDESQKPIKPKTVAFTAKDGLTITADLYVAAKGKASRVIVLCHQAKSSRGEYRQIAPRLVRAGYSCLAVDARAGKGMNNVENQTALRARLKDKTKTIQYGEARQDIVAAIKWLNKEGFKRRYVLWGSSYSAALAVKIASKTKWIRALVLFAPGEYVRPRGSVKEAAAKLKVPLLAVSPEKERKQVTPIYENCANKGKELLCKVGILHGSKTLFKGNESGAAWATVEAFLSKHAKP